MVDLLWGDLGNCFKVLGGARVVQILPLQVQNLGGRTRSFGAVW